jgi:hypothetical protein
MVYQTAEAKKYLFLCTLKQDKQITAKFRYRPRKIVGVETAPMSKMVALNTLSTFAYKLVIRSNRDHTQSG